MIFAYADPPYFKGNVSTPNTTPTPPYGTTKKPTSSSSKN